MIKLVKQPSYNTCTSACLAMLTGLPVEQVVEEFHERWFDKDTRNSQHNPFTYLCSKGLTPFLCCNPYDNYLYEGVVSLLTVPSLNLIGKNHHILVDYQSDHKWKVLDPSSKKTFDMGSLSGWSTDLYLRMNG